MSSLTISLCVFACIGGGTLFGMFLRSVLPEQHLSDDSKDTVRQSMGLISTMAALLLGLLVASAKSAYDTQKSEISDLAAKVIVLDVLLAEYGPETHDIRQELRKTVSAAVDRLWPADRSQGSQLEPANASGAALHRMIQELKPANDVQRSVQSQIASNALELGKTRTLLYAQEGSSISQPLLIMMACWLVVVFAGFGLYAPRNVTVVAALLLCAISVSGAMFLILEMDKPFTGIIRISDAPMRAALTRTNN
jgi:hypothetical protein